MINNISALRTVLKLNTSLHSKSFECLALLNFEFDLTIFVNFRKVMREAASGGRDAERVKLKLEIKVEVAKEPHPCSLWFLELNLMNNIVFFAISAKKD